MLKCYFKCVIIDEFIDIEGGVVTQTNSLYVEMKDKCPDIPQ